MFYCLSKANAACTCAVSIFDFSHFYTTIHKKGQRNSLVIIWVRSIDYFGGSYATQYISFVLFFVLFWAVVTMKIRFLFCHVWVLRFWWAIDSVFFVCCFSWNGKFELKRINSSMIDQMKKKIVYFFRIEYTFKILI